MILMLRNIFCIFLFSFQLLAADQAARKADLTISIPMRDELELPTDLYFPEDSSKDLPCVLIRSPGGRSSRHALAFTYLTKLGYLVAIQETRCSLDKTGRTLPYCTDGWGFHQDGYDTVQWLGKSEFTNGKIGTVGASAMGITQLLMAPTAPPALQCQYIGMAAANLYAEGIFLGGQFLKHQVEGWLGIYARDPEVLAFIKKNDTYNIFWRNLDTTQVHHLVTVPGMFYSGWYDVFVQGTLDAFVGRNEKGAQGAKGTQKIIIGPWTHMWPLTKKLGDFEVPLNAQAPFKEFLPEYWFGFYLKGEENGAKSLPAVTYYVMGPFDQSPSKGNVWKTAKEWPIPAQVTPFYLRPDQMLSTQSLDTLAKVQYRYDPNQPTPTIGGKNLFLESGPKDQRPIEQRSDTLVFTSEPLQEDLEVTGRIIAKIYLSSNCRETDVVVRLTDVYPDGRSLLITDGLKRTCTLDQYSENAPCEVEVDLWSTSMVFAKGHSIRVSISSSSYPRFEKSLNEGSPQIADNQIHFGGNVASRILLPIVK